MPTIYQLAYVTFTVKNGVRTDSGMIFTTSETPNVTQNEAMLRIQHGYDVEVLGTRVAPTP